MSAQPRTAQAFDIHLVRWKSSTACGVNCVNGFDRRHIAMSSMDSPNRATRRQRRAQSLTRYLFVNRVGYLYNFRTKFEQISGFSNESLDIHRHDIVDLCDVFASA